MSNESESDEKENSYRMRRAAKRGKHRTKLSFSDEPPVDAEEYITGEIAIADDLIRKGKYFDAYEVLFNTYTSPDYEEIPQSRRNKYDAATLKRSERIIRHGDNKTIKYALDLRHEIRKHIAKRHRKGGLEKTLGTLAIIGLLGGLFFLLPNITGNVVYNSTLTDNNFIGYGLLVIGIMGALFYFLKKK